MIQRSNAALMRKTESKMNDLSVTGKIVSSGYKTRNQQSKTSNQPVRPQRRYSGVHKVNHRKSLRVGFYAENFEFGLKNHKCLN